MTIKQSKIFQFLLFLLLPILFIHIDSLVAQVPSNLLGLNPARQKWSSLENEVVKIIYPQGLDSQAQRVASIATYLSNRNDDGIGEAFKKIDIILHNNTVIPNGFVTVGPFRSEFYLSPPQYYPTTPWLDMLAIHEYRHIKQFSNGQKGLSGLGKTLFGSWAWGGLVSTALPRWFFEGDAILMETALTASGRGRLPSFEMEYKALALQGQYYNYEKASAGSFKSFVPDWYTLGYYLTLEAREQYGIDIWAKVVQDATRYKGLFFPFSRALKKYTGLTTKKLYQQKFDELYQKWIPSSTQGSHLQLDIASPKTITHYNNLIPIDNQRWIAIKSSFRDWNHLIEVDEEGNEKKLCNIGITIDPLQSTLSLSNNLVVWSELTLHPRWYNVQYQSIYSYHLKTGKKKKLTARSKYFSPSLSPDGKKIIAVELLSGGNTQLVVLDAHDGSLLEKPIINNSGFFSFPIWLESNIIASVLVRNERASIQLLDLDSKTWKELTPELPFTISHLFAYGKHIYFSAAYSGTNNIYKVNTANGNISAITQHELGAFQPSFNPFNQQLYFSGFSAQGYQPLTLNEDPIPFDPNTQSKSLPSIGPIVQQENTAPNQQNTEDPITTSLIKSIPKSLELPVEKFKKRYHLFNPHSILPYIYPPIGGLRILSDNTFSTLSGELATYYNFNENKATYLGEMVYGGWFTQLEIGAGIYNRRSNYANFNIPNDTTVIFSQYSSDWLEKRIKLGINLPLRWTANGYNTQLSARLNYQFIDIEAPDAFLDLSENGETLVGSKQGINTIKPFLSEPFQEDQIHTLHTQIAFRYAKQTSIQELGPDFGITAQLSNRYAIGKYLGGNSLRVNAGIHLAGLAKTHAASFQISYQKEKYLDNYKFPNIFFNPRGYASQIGDQWLKYTFDYKIPIWYPDIALGPLAFFQRISTNIFYDSVRIDLNAPFNQTNYLSSAGMELVFDVRLIRLLDVRAGIRYSYAFDKDFTVNKKNHQFDFFVLGISG